MYLQGTAIWHPRCGPGPNENGTVLNGLMENEHPAAEERPDSKLDHSCSVSETQVNLGWVFKWLDYFYYLKSPLIVMFNLFCLIF